MKITFVIYSLESGGAERAVSGLANHFSSAHEVSIITLVKSEPFYKLDPNINLHYCLNDSKKSTNLFSSFTDGIERIRKLIYWFKQDQSEVVVSFMTKTNIYSIWSAKLLGIPCIVSERANHERNRLPSLLEKLRNISYKRADALVVQTIGNKNYYTNLFKDTFIKVIPNAIDNVFALNNIKSRKNNQNIILNVGAFRNGKAQDVLIRAFSKLKLPDWRLVFLGKGPNLNKFRDLAEQLGVIAQVEFMGAQKDVASYYNKASLFVFTSEHEGFPNALLEALYFGIPSISTNCPHGPSDMIQDGKNGFLVPVDDEDTLAQKIQILIESEKLQQKFSNAALESTKKYEMETIAVKWLEVIKSVTTKNA